MPTLNTQKLFFAFLLLETFYLMMTVFVPFLPGWRMFEAIERAPFQIINYDSKKNIDVSKYLPPVYYDLSPPIIKELAQFICRKERISIGLEIKTTPATTLVINKNDCKI